MDLRSLIDKLDTIEQNKLLLESEQLMEKVRIRYSDVEAVAKQNPTDDNARGQALAKLAKDNGLSTLFDPVSGELVNADGSYSTFKGADEATVNRLKDWGLLPLNAKTSSWLGFRGQDRTTAIGDNQTAQSRDQMVDRAEELMKKAVTSGAVAKESIEESLLKSFGYDTTLLEAITSQEHTELKGLVQKLTPFAKQDPDAADIVARFNAYNEKRDDLIARIKELISAMSPATAPAPSAPAPSAPAERGGSSASESVSGNYKKPIFELKATKPGITIHKPNFLGYLSPEKAKHNADMLRAGNAELETSDQIGQNVKDLANGITFNFADKAAAYLDSVATGTKYSDQLAKYKDGTDAYNTNKDAFNVHRAADAMGYEIDKDNPLGNITPGDLGSLFTGAGLFRVGAKGVAKLGKFGAGKKVQNTAGLTTGVVAPATAATLIGNPEATEAAKDMTAGTLKAMQKELVDAGADLGEFGPDKNGVDGKFGKLTRDAMTDPKYADIVQKYIKSNSSATSGKKPTSSAPTSSAPTSSAPAFVQDPSITPEVVKTALTKLGVTGNSITPEQLLALATSLGINSVAESTELDDIRKLSGMKEYQDLEEGAFDRFAPWVITKMTDAGQGELARLASMIPKRGMSAAEIESIRAAKAVAKKIEAQGPPAGAAVPAPPASSAATGLDPAADAAKQMVGKSAAELQAMANNPSLTALQRKAATAELQRIGGAVDNAAVPAVGAVDNAAGAVDNAAGAARTSLLYKTTYALGKMGGKFTQLVKNNKFLSLLAALTAAGIAVYLLRDTSDTLSGGANGAGGVQPQPGTDPKEEERKRQLTELEKLLARLYGGWPTDTETAEAIQAAIAVGAKDPSGAAGNNGAVQTQPAATKPRIDPRSGLDMNRFN